MSLLADITVSRTYAQVKADGTKENWNEIVNRYLDMLTQDFPQYKDRIIHYGKLIHDKKILPSMRMLQFAGSAIARENARGYNCSALAITSTKDIADLFYLLMCGTGVGYSVQQHHVSQLASELISSKLEMDTYQIPDSREGWADSVRYLLLNPHIEFDYSLIRTAGSPVSSGGTASGPESLKRAHDNIRKVLYNGHWPKLRPIDVHDICCHIADVVVVGGVRRSAMICIFDKDDELMSKCKSGEWWKDNPQRARANNSAMLVRGTVSQEEFTKLLDITFNSYAGEPGIFWSGTKEMITNPCVEIALNSHQFCNLTTINFSNVMSVDDFALRAKAATLFGTLQAAYTNFNYISEEWTHVTQRERLLGVSMTGLGDNWKCFEAMALSGDIANVAYAMKQWNYEFATALGIEPAARITTIKPEGTTSVVLDTTSGMHSAYAEYFIRRVRIGRTTELGQYLESKLSGTPFWEIDQFNESNGIIALPMAMPGARTRNQETATQQLERMKLLKDCWIDPGHRYGTNTHNVSITVYYKEEEREELKKWMWDNRYSYTGISLLPYDGGTYIQAPFEEISQEKYRDLRKQLDTVTPSINLSEIKYNVSTEHKAQLEIVACGGGSCELK